MSMDLSFHSFDLGDVAVALGLLATGGSATWWVLRKRLGEDFATQRTVNQLGERLGKVEEQLRHVPTQSDLSRLEARVQGVENTVGQARAEVAKVGAVVEVEFRSMREMVSRTERLATMLVRHALEKEGTDAG